MSPFTGRGSAFRAGLAGATPARNAAPLPGPHPPSQETDPAGRFLGRALLQRLALHALLLASAGVALLPLLWLVAASVKSPADQHAYLFFPPVGDWSLDSFVRLFTKTDFPRLVANSMFVTCATVLVQLLLAALGGWALAAYRFPGKKLIMGLMVVTMMIPGAVLLAPNYEMIWRLGLMDSHLGLIVPGAVSVFGMLLFRQSMRAIPTELVQSARVDGCGEWGIFWHIALPLSRPMIAAWCLIAFMGTWNSFLWPQIILQSRDLFTLPIGINQLTGQYQDDQGALMAGTLLAILPVVALFLLLQREFIAGLTAGAVKG